MEFAGCKFGKWKKFEFGWRRTDLSKQSHGLITIYYHEDYGYPYCRLRLHGNDHLNELHDFLKNDFNKIIDEKTDIEEIKCSFDCLLLNYDKLKAFW